MGSKTSPPITAALDAARQDDIEFRSATIKAAASNRLLRRIADALQVSQSVLFNPLSAVAPIHDPGRDDGHGPDGALDRECVALLHAYMQIRDPKARCGLLAQVQSAAERDGTASSNR